MWIYSPERGLFNLDKVSRISFDDSGTYLSVDGVIIYLVRYDASEKIMQAIKNNQNFLEV